MRGVAALLVLLCTWAARAEEVDRLLARMSLEEKAGQVLFITAGGARLGAPARRFLARVRPGGLALFGYHLRTPGQIRALTRDLWGAVGAVPPFLAVDHEGGAVVRVKSGVPRLPGSPIFGAAGEPRLAERAGRLVGAALRELGFNMNLAPVLDVPRAGGGRYLRARAYGGDADLVARLGAAFARGLQAAGVAAAAKHFPGEGSSHGDPHRGLPAARAGVDELVRLDLLPFRASPADAIMVGHVTYPALDHKPRPASLSPAVYALLREKARFRGVAVTDGLEMRSVRARVGHRRAAVEALRAGADMVSLFWTPRRIVEARDALVAAVRQGEVPRARLDEAVRRVLEAKRVRGILGGLRSHAPREQAAPRLADLGRAAARWVRGRGAAPEDAPVLSRDPEALRRAGARSIDLRRTPLPDVLGRAAARGAVVVVGAETRLARALGRRGVRVVAIVPAPPARARRFPAASVVAAWDRSLLGGALEAVLGRRSPAFTASQGR